MRRRPFGVMLAAAGLVLAGAATGCGSSVPAEPTLATVNFTPKLVITVGPDGLAMAKGPRDDGTVSLNPPAIGSGTVISITNTTKTDHHLQGDGGKAFDTGILRAGATTTLVLTNTNADDKAVHLTDVDDPTIDAIITVRPKPAA